MHRCRTFLQGKQKIQLHGRAGIYLHAISEKIKSKPPGNSSGSNAVVSDGLQNKIPKKYNLNEIDEKKYKDAVFYKEIPVDNDDFYERLIVTYSIKYRNYQQKIRENQIRRAENALKNGKVRKKKNANDFRRFIASQHYTEDGEVAEKSRQYIDQSVIDKEKIYDGFYALSTNLDDETPEEIVSVNHNRWQIEQCFRTMKSEFKARPAYVCLEEHIAAHFLTCFISLVIYRYLEKKLRKHYSCEQLVQTLRDMQMREVLGEGYIPVYTRNDITDDPHESFGFMTDYDIITKAVMKKIRRKQKNEKVTQKNESKKSNGC